MNHPTPRESVTIRALIIDGSGPDRRSPVLNTLRKELDSAGWKTGHVRASALDTSPCTGCFGCWVKTPGMCVIDDEARVVTGRILHSDLVILLTPVTFGGYSSHLKRLLDRSISIMLPYFTKIDGKVHHRRRYAKYPRLAVIGTMPAPDEVMETVFRKLAERNSINAHAPSLTVDVFSEKTDQANLGRRLRALLKTAGGGGA